MRVLYSCATYGNDEIAAVNEVLRDPTKLVGGERTRQFEAAIAKLFGKSTGVFVNSGSSANLLAVRMLDLPPGAEVVTPALTFSTTVAPLLQAGLAPALVDVAADSYVVDANAVEESITARTKALMIPSLIGNIPDYPRLQAVARAHDLYLIEDSCDTIGATIAGQPTGTFTDVSTTSFYASHVITAMGNGGMVCVNSDADARKLRVLRGWGRSSAGDESESVDSRFAVEVDGTPYDAKFVFEAVGYNFLAGEAAAAFGLAQLDNLEDFGYRRRSHFARLCEHFGTSSDYFILPSQRPDVRTNWLAFPLTLADHAPFSRTELALFLEGRGIQTRPVFAGNVARHPAFKGKIDWRPDVFPNADRVMRRGLLVGCHQGLSETQIEFTLEVFDEFLRRYI